MPLSSGTRLGPYEITAPLGGGGMGEVYRARDSKLGRDVALKVLSPALAGDADYMARFTREAQVLASLNHPNIAAIYGLEESGGVRALVMELVEGRTLAERISAGPLPMDEALGIARQIAEALEAAHEKGIVHRDLKPANVKITPAGVVKVLDFGLAKTVEPAVVTSASSPTLTMRATAAGVIMGTAAYMSPEQARGMPVDKRADIWAYGVVLFEMLTGREMFSGETISDTLAAVLKSDPDWSALPADTPAAIRRLLRRCLERAPKRRLQDIGDARLEIEEALAGPAEVVPASVHPKATPWLWIAAAAVFALGATGLSLVHFRETPPRQPLTTFGILAPENTVGMDDASLSPDGRRIAFFATPKGTTARLLFVRSLDTLTPRALKGAEGAGAPFWSPDGRFLAFRAGGKLKKIDVNGGPPQILCDSDSGGVLGAWNSDGVILFSQQSGGLYRVSAAGGTPTLVSTPDRSRKETRHMFPQFLPGGLRYLFVAGSDQAGGSTLNVGSLDSQQRTVIMPTESNVMFAPAESGARQGRLLFVRNGVLLAQPFDSERVQMAGDAFPVAENISASPFATAGSVLRKYSFSVSDTGTLIYWTPSGQNEQLAWFDRSGKQLETVGPASQLSGVALAPDGQHIVAAMGDFGNMDLWLLDGARGTSSRFTFVRGQNNRPVFSPDGSRVAFYSGRPSGPGLYQKSANGTGAEEKLLESKGPVFLSDWSRDGRFLTYSVVDPDLQRDLWVLPLAGDRKPFPFLKTAANENFPRFSPDGRWIAYQSDESGKDQVYVLPFAPRASADGKWQISVDGGVGGRWRSDGKELFYLAGSRLMAVEVSAVGGTFRAGIPKMLFDTRMSSPFYWNNYTPSADGRRFLIATPVAQEASLPMTVVMNWMASLKN